MIYEVLGVWDQSATAGAVVHHMMHIQRADLLPLITSQTQDTDQGSA